MCNGHDESTYDVFISYRHETGFYMAQILYLDLIAKGYTVFMDKVMGSCEYRDEIHDAVLHSKNFVTVLFPEDREALFKESSWLNIEANWALENERITMIPMLCDGFAFPEDEEGLSAGLRKLAGSNGVKVQKGPSIDRELNHLCDVFLKNVTPSKPTVTEAEFYRYHLSVTTDRTLCGVDMAFHAGARWLMEGEKNTLLIAALDSGVPVRVMINTVRAAESIAKHMRSETATHLSFAKGRDGWKKLARRYAGQLEVRECPIPLLHVYHGARLKDNQSGRPFGEQLIKYYAYTNTQLDNAYEHKVSSASQLYGIYSREFEALWEKSRRLG